jgi:hypothetical protein
MSIQRIGANDFFYLTDVESIEVLRGNYQAIMAWFSHHKYDPPFPIIFNFIMERTMRRREHDNVIILRWYTGRITCYLYRKK